MKVGPGDDSAERAADAVRAVGGPTPEVAIILGSGLGSAIARIEPDVEMSFGDIPGFPTPTVPGHEGRLILGKLAGVEVAAFLGRVHLYEGHPMDLVTLSTRLIAELGVRTLISTGAVGGIDPTLEGGQLVVGTDHISFLGDAPLRGWRDGEGRPPFVDLSSTYDPALAELALTCATQLNIPCASGVYAAMPGPSYETPTEVEFLRRAGATVVGMSVVPEAVAATALGMRFGALFCVTNVVGVEPVDHGDVTRVADRFGTRLGDLLEAMLSKL